MTDDAPIHDAAGPARYIESRYHRRHREQLPPLADMAERVETVPAGLTEHMHLENDVLFPQFEPR